MKKQGDNAAIILAALGLLILIVDTKTALQGATEGIELCIRTVLPSLFPFFYLSGIINKHLRGKSAKLLRPIGKLCGIPEGSEPILVIGWLGGYPVGAQIISDAFRNGSLTKNDAERMLAFCSQPGPAFIFAVIGNIFQNMQIAIVLWIIILLSSVITASIFPWKSKNQCNIVLQNQIDPFVTAVRAISYVSGWVILFRIMIALLQSRFLWMLPQEFAVILSGLLELTNGCMALSGITNYLIRLIIATSILTFGGLCVGLQTKSVTAPLRCHNYFIGKIVQSVIAVILVYLYCIIAYGVL